MPPHAGPSGSATRQEAAALPFMAAPDGLRILLVRERPTAAWLVPQTRTIETLPPHRAAERWAVERFGLIGEAADMPIGAFEYQAESGQAGQQVLCRVDVFPMRVTRLRSRWPARGAVERSWFSGDHAVRMVGEPSLVRLILRLAALGPMPSETSPLVARELSVAQPQCFSPSPLVDGDSWSFLPPLPGNDCTRADAMIAAHTGG